MSPLSCTHKFTASFLHHDASPVAILMFKTIASLHVIGSFLPLIGNERLVALADIFSEDSSSALCQLDVRYSALVLNTEFLVSEGPVSRSQSMVLSLSECVPERSLQKHYSGNIQPQTSSISETSHCSSNKCCDDNIMLGTLR